MMNLTRRIAGSIAAALLGIMLVGGFTMTSAVAAEIGLAINEVQSDPDDWFELVNTTDAEIDLTGLWYVDNAVDDPTHWYALSGTIAAGAVVAIDSENGFGKGDSLSIYSGDHATYLSGTAALVSTVTWADGTHVSSLGLCPAPYDGYVDMVATKGAANVCPTPGLTEIRINEVYSAGTDFVEIVNTGTVAIDINGWTAVDGDTSHTPLVLATTQTLIAPGGYHVFYPDNEPGGFGLGKADSMTIALPDGTQVDTTTWPVDTHADPSWGRCPDGAGQFAMTLAATPGAANECAATPGADQIRINEVSSDPEDWVELLNIGSTAVDLSGWLVSDNAKLSDPEKLQAIPAGTRLAAGEVLAFDYTVAGLGKGDEVNLYLPDALTLVDTTTWPADAHADPSWGRLPDGTGEFGMTGAATRGALNTGDEGATSVVLNEVSNVTGQVELLNNGDASVDISGWQLLNAGAQVVHTVEAGTTLAAGAFYVADGVTVLGSADALTVRTAMGTTVATFAWAEDGIESYSRCEAFGEVSFAETPTATFGVANACPVLASEAWPGLATVRTVDELNGFGDGDGNGEGDVSGAVFDPVDPDILWVVQNKNTLHKLHKVNGVYSAVDGWEGGKRLHFADGTGAVDSEGVTIAPDGSVYVTSERDNDNSSVSYNMILRYDLTDVTASTTDITASHEWDVNGYVVTGTNLGLEGITYVPDTFLVTSGWRVDGTPYTAGAYPGEGLYGTAVEGTGALHFFALPLDGEPAEVKVESSGFPWAMDVTYDADRSAIWALCDDGCGGVYNVLKVNASGDFVIEHSYARPAGMPNLNNEGMAIRPARTAVDGLIEVVWTDDGDTNGYSLREGYLYVPETVGEPGTDTAAPGASDAGAPTVSVQTGGSVLLGADGLPIAIGVLVLLGLPGALLRTTGYHI